MDGHGEMERWKMGDELSLFSLVLFLDSQLKFSNLARNVNAMTTGNKLLQIQLNNSGNIRNSAPLLHLGLLW